MRRSGTIILCLNLVAAVLAVGSALASDDYEGSESAPVIRGEVDGSDAALVAFRLAPPDGTMVEEHVTRVVGSDYGSRGTRIDVLNAVSVQKYMKSEEDTYRIRVDIQGISALKNGKPVVNPIVEAMRNARLFYVIDPSGRVARIEGMDGVAKILKSHIPKQKLTPEVEKAISAEDMEQKEMADWNARFGSWNRQFFLPGKMYYGIGTYTLEPGMFIRYGISAKVIPDISCYEGAKIRNCVKVRFEYATEPDLIEKGRMASIREAAEFMKRGDVVGGMLEGHLERIVDPSTLLIYSEVQKKTVLFPLSVSDTEEIRVRRIERTEFKYRFDHMPPVVPQLAASPE